MVAIVLSLLVTGGEDPEPQTTPRPSTTPSATPTEAPTVALADVDTRTTAVTRDTFCAAVDPGAVESALGRPPTAATQYADGQRTTLAGGVRDISHEFGCTWTASKVSARAWVFAPPVSSRTAAGLVRDARREDGCRAIAGAPDFGSPSIALRCRTDRGVQASYRGLFGDAWVTCVVGDRRPGRGADVVERAEQWCVAVLAAAAS